MALGSSAPEIMLNVLETVMTLGQKPGELGASTIVGSAAFNLLIISAVSIMSVTEETDERTDEEIMEDGTGKGVKKIKMQGVFAVTTSFSIIAYVWMYLVLQDELVEPYEAWITLALMPLLIVVALAADKLSGSGDAHAALTNGDDILPVLNAAEFIQLLTDEKAADKIDNNYET
jgi:solute carrier family 8 (sodium/calcium exchanger)